MRHIESDIINYLEKHPRINEYEFNLPFPFKHNDTDMIGNPILINCVAIGITNGLVFGVNNYGEDYEWLLIELDYYVLLYILRILEHGEFKILERHE